MSDGNSESNASRRAGELLRCALLLAVVAVLWAPRLRGPIDLRFDAGVYYTLGTSLADGKGYRLLNEPGDPPAVQYPPLLPATIAAFQKVVGTSDPLRVGIALRVTSIVVSAAYVLLAYFVARRMLSAWWAFLAAVGCAGHMWFVFLSDLCFAEMPFALVSMTFLLLTLDAKEASWRREAIAGVLGAIGFLFRTAGVTLLAAWVGEALMHKRWRHAAVRASVTIVCVVGWQAYVASIRAGPSYERPAYAYQRAPYQYYNVSYGENLALADPYDPAQGNLTAKTMAWRTDRHLRDMPAVLGETVSAPRGFWHWLLRAAERSAGRLYVDKTFKAPAVALGYIVIIGLGFFAWQRRWLVVGYVALSVLLIATTPWPPQFLRYTAPLAPLLFTALLMPVAMLVAWAMKIEEPVWRRLLLACAAAVPAAAFAAEAYTLYKLNRRMFTVARYDFGHDGKRVTHRLFFYDDAWRSFDATLDWLTPRVSAGDVVVTSAPHWTHLRTGAQAVQPPFERDPAEALRLIEGIPAKYVIIDAFTYPGGEVSRRYAQPAIEAGTHRWELVFTSPSPAAVHVYQRAR